MSPRPTPADRSDPRVLAFEVLDRVERAGAFASVLLERHEGRLDDPRDRGLAHRLVLGVLQTRAILDHAAALESRRALRSIDPAVLTVLRIGIYSLLFLDRVPGFAAVDRSVDLVKHLGLPRAAGFVNAVLRGVARRGASALPAPAKPGDVEGLALYHSHPRWWTERVVRRLGWPSAEALLRANNRPAPTVLRVNRRRSSAETLARELAAAGARVERSPLLDEEVLRVLGGADAAAAAMQRGDARAQDEASQLVVRLLGSRVGPRVLDLCAAPGGKSLQIAEMLGEGARLVSVDRHLGRLRRMMRLAHRVGCEGLLPLCADMKPERCPVRGRFDQLLVDAPCSGTGTLRRHPEIRWRLRPSDPARLAATQIELLRSAARLASPGARIVYSVCSLEPEEGEQVVSRFLEESTGYRVAEIRGMLPEPCRAWVGDDGFLRTTPAVGEVDGFFAAALDAPAGAGSGRAGRS